MNTYESAIKTRKSRLLKYFQAPMKMLSYKVGTVWSERDRLDIVLEHCLKLNRVLKNCHQIYSFDLKGQLVSSLVRHEEVIRAVERIDLSERLYFKKYLPKEGLRLSRAYTCLRSGKNCATAVQTVKMNGKIIGYVAADFLLLDLPQEEEVTEDRRIWMQVKGDPSIRGTLFMQTRTISLMDDALDDVITIMEELFTERGLFHCQLHFSSSRCTFWLYEDPYRYRVHVLDEMLHDVLLAYPKRPYPTEATVRREQIRPILEQFKLLREMDETIYLRSGSLNIINGIVGLNFSCDGSHYMPAEDLLEKGEDFWFGAMGSTIQ